MSDITLEKVERAMVFLAETDVTYGDLKANVERMDILRRRMRQRVFLTEEGTVAERNAKADTYADVTTADDNYIAAIADFEKLKAKRERADLVIRVWQSIEASRRRA